MVAAASDAHACTLDRGGVSARSPIVWFRCGCGLLGPLCFREEDARSGHAAHRASAEAVEQPVAFEDSAGGG